MLKPAPVLALLTLASFTIACGTSCPEGLVKVETPMGERCTTVAMSSFVTCIEVFRIVELDRDARTEAAAAASFQGGKFEARAISSLRVKYAENPPALEAIDSCERQARDSSDGIRPSKKTSWGMVVGGSVLAIAAGTGIVAAAASGKVTGSSAPLAYIGLGAGAFFGILLFGLGFDPPGK
jgi:hypothetical protein